MTKITVPPSNKKLTLTKTAIKSLKAPDVGDREKPQVTLFGTTYPPGSCNC